MKHRVGTELSVGIFIIIAVAAFVFLTFRVSGLTSFVRSGGYNVTAEFYNIGGLKVRAPVSLAGVRLGEVTSITLNPDTFEALVTIHFDDNNIKLPVDTSARILTQGLLGENFIDLSPGSLPADLKDNSRIRTTFSAMVLQDLISKFVFNVNK